MFLNYKNTRGEKNVPLQRKMPQGRSPPPWLWTDPCCCKAEQVLKATFPNPLWFLQIVLLEGNVAWWYFLF